MKKMIDDRVLPPQVLAVVEECFKGCGLSLSEVFSSHQFEKERERIRALRVRFPAGTDLGDCYRAGPLISGWRLGGYGGSPETYPRHEWKESPTFAALLRIFERELMSSAKACLPETIELPKEVSRKLFPDIRLPISLKKLTNGWHCANQEERRQIASLITRFFKGKDRDTSIEEDCRDQPRERVLPKLFGRFSYVGHRSNCIAKSLLVAAFGERARAHMLSAGLILRRDSHAVFAMAEAAEAIQTLYQSSAILELRDDVVQTFDNTLRYAKKLREEGELSHMAVAFEVSQRDWMLLDANFKCSTVLDDAWKLPELKRLLYRHSEVLPGLSVVRRQPKIEDLYGQEVEEIKLLCKHAKDDLSNIADVDTADGVISLYAKSPLLRAIYKNAKDPNPSSRERLLSAKLRLVNRCENGPTIDKKDQEHAMEQLEKLVAYEISFDEAMKSWRESVFDSLWAPVTRMKSQWKHFLDSWDGLAHAQIQFANHRNGFATWIMAHVAEDMGLGEEIEVPLNHCSFDALRLTASANAPALGAPHDEFESKLSSEILTHLRPILAS